jgi:nitroreductase
MVVKFRFRYVVLTLLFVCIAGITVAKASEVTQLPDPQTVGGPSVFDMLRNRASALGASFPTEKVSHEELSTLLWAATGLNRPDRGWTVPMAMGREPYVRVYVTGEDGTFLYDWNEHTLIKTSNEDGRKTISRQGFVENASHVLIFVQDTKAIESFGARGTDFGAVAVGAMTQNVYLAAEALGIGTRYLVNLNPDVIHTICGLDAVDVPLCIMPIGKR